MKRRSVYEIFLFLLFLLLLFSLGGCRGSSGGAGPEAPPRSLPAPQPNPSSSKPLPRPQPPVPSTKPSNPDPNPPKALKSDTDGDAGPLDPSRGAYPEYAEAETGNSSNNGIDYAEFKDAPAAMHAAISGVLDNSAGYDSDCFAVSFDRAGANYQIGRASCRERV